MMLYVCVVNVINKPQKHNTMIPEKNDYIKTQNHKYSTRILDVSEDSIKIKYSDYWDSSNVWISLDCIQYNENDGEWEVVKTPSYK